MRKQIRIHPLLKTFVLVFTITAIASKKTSLQIEGHETGHGGDARAAEFVAIAQDVLANIKKSPLNGIDPALLSEAIKNTKVRTTEDILLDVATGKEVDAINHPQKTPPEIVLNKAAWDGLKDGFKKRRLALHEYLNIIGAEDSRYQLSSLIDRTGLCSKAPALTAALKRAFGGAACDAISSDDQKWLSSIEFLEEDNLKELRIEDFQGLDLNNLSVIVPGWCALRTEIRNQLNKLTVRNSQSSLSSCQDFTGFSKLKRLELQNVSSAVPTGLKSLPSLDELILVSKTSQPTRLDSDSFKNLKTPSLRRIVFCDVGETEHTNYVRIPNFQLKDNVFQDMSSVEEATLCLNLSSQSRAKTNHRPLKHLSSLTHLWIKVDDWSKLKNDFFTDLKVGTRVALIPSGSAIEKSTLKSLPNLDCSRGWDWANEKKHDFVPGKIYCLKTSI